MPLDTLTRPSLDPLWNAEADYDAHVRETYQGVTSASIGHDILMLQQEGRDLADLARSMARMVLCSYWISDRTKASRLIEEWCDALEFAGAEVVRQAARAHLQQASQQ